MCEVKNSEICLSNTQCSCKFCHKPPKEKELSLNIGEERCSCNLCEKCKNYEVLPQKEDPVTNYIYDKVKSVKGNWLCLECFKKPLCYIDFCYTNVKKDKNLISFFPNIAIAEIKK